MNPNVLKRLLDALEGARYAMQFVTGSDLERYRADRLLRSAVERQLEIVGEALGRARSEDPRLDALFPDLSKIIGLRHRLAHGYSEIDDAIVWSVVVEELPELARRLDELWPTYGELP